MTTNQLKWAEIRETGRHNVETESQGRRKLAQDYEVGSRQAGAAESQAATAAINAATRQEELAQDIREYEEVGKDETKSKTDNIDMDTHLKGAKYWITLEDLDQKQYDRSKRESFGYQTVDTAGEMIDSLVPFVKFSK